MRYQNWDVLLFPNLSRTPVQEFDAKCHVLHSPRAPTATGTSASDDPFIDKFESMNKVPILTCFIPSLNASTPFRISIHSWSKPIGSTVLRTYMPIEEKIAFEARVYVDGIHHCNRILQAETVWPEVIETSDLAQHDGVPELRFPPFHPEILQQAHWDAGEQLGRIKIILSEGVMRQNRMLQQAHLTFDRLRDVVAFSFQHAPQQILEYSGIAWPNARMFENTPRDPRRPAPIISRLTGRTNYDAHAHSPQRSGSAYSRPVAHNSHENGEPSDRVLQLGRGITSGTVVSLPTVASVAPLSTCEDPFMGPSSETRQWRGKVQSNGTDDTMLDYESNALPVGPRRTSTEMSGVSWPRKDFQRHMDEAAIDEIIQALSPEKKDRLVEALSPAKSSNSGLHPPANTPKTEKASKQSSPILKASNNILASSIEVSPGLSRRLSTSEESSDSTPSVRDGGSVGHRRTLDRALVTRSQKGMQSDPRPTTNRTRSRTNGSRKKRSLSPIIRSKRATKIVLSISSDSHSSDKENQRLTEEDDGLDGVSLVTG